MEGLSWNPEQLRKDCQEEGKCGVCAVYIVLNECEYLWASLQSIYPCVDKIIIVEGATQYAIRDVVSPEGLSTDGTPQLIQAFKETLDFLDKIKWIRVGWVENKAALRNRGLEHVPEGASFFLRMDGDRLLRVGELKLALRAMLDNPSTLVAEARHYMFWGSTHRLLELVPDSEYIGMLFRYYPDMYCAGHEELYSSIGHSYYEDPAWIIRPEGFNLYHYSWVKDRRKLVLKRWERLRQMRAEAQHVESLRYLKEKDDHDLYLEAISHCKAFNAANLDPQRESIMPFTGVHPEQILSHSSFGRDPKFFGCV